MFDNIFFGRFNRLVFLRVLVLLVGVILLGGWATPAEADVWVIETVLDASAHPPYLVMDAAGHPHLAIGAGTMRYYYYNGTTWESSVVDAGASVSSSPAMALDGNGKAHIAYIHSTGPTLRYATNQSGTWVSEDIGQSNSTLYSVTIAASQGGIPHIIYMLSGNMKYAYKDGGGWHTEEIGAGDGMSAILLDGLGQPHIAYLRNHQIIYSYRDGTGWHPEAAFGAGTNSGFLTMRFDSHGLPYIAFYNDLTDKVSLVRKTGRAWSSEAVIGMAAPGDRIWLVLDAQDHPSVVYREYPSRSIKLAEYNGTAWAFTTIASGTGTGFAGPVLAYGLDGRPMIFYSDTALTEIRLARLVPPPPPTIRYVEQAGVCAGLTPCYTTITLAVAASNPGDAIHVFPGTYAESVNLSTMAIMGSLALKAADDAGDPARSTVTVAPASGAAIYTSAQHLGQISLSGFIVQSSTTDGVNISSTSNIIADGLVANNTPRMGMSLAASGHITVTKSTASSNNIAGENGNGFYLSAGGRVYVEASTADNNDDEGFDIASGGGVTIVDSSGSGNSDDAFDIETGGDVLISGSAGNGGLDDWDADGFDIETNGDVTVLDTVANNNAQEGVDVQYADGDVLFDHVQVDGNSTEGMDIDEVYGTITILSSQSINNGGDGLQIAEEGGTAPVIVKDSVFNNNGWSGMATLNQQGDVWLERVQAVGNSTADLTDYEGFYLVSAAGSVTVLDCLARNNVGPGDADGFEIGNVHGNLLMRNVTAQDNAAQGVEVYNIGETITIEASHFQGNGVEGISLSTAGQTPTLQGSVICENTTGLKLNYAAYVNAEGNWWGCAEGPGNAGCDAVTVITGTVDTLPVVNTVNGSAFFNPVGVGYPTPVTFALSGGGGSVFLGKGPGAFHSNEPLFQVMTNNGLLISSQGSGATVAEFVNQPGGTVQVTLIPATQGTASVTLAGPCGVTALAKALEVQVNLSAIYFISLPLIQR